MRKHFLDIEETPRQEAIRKIYEEHRDRETQGQCLLDWTNNKELRLIYAIEKCRQLGLITTERKAQIVSIYERRKDLKYLSAELDRILQQAQSTYKVSE